MARKPQVHPEPKFQIGHSVRVKAKHDILVGKAERKEDRADGTIVSIVIKKNKIGARTFYYDVFWGSGVTSQHLQSRLQSMDR